MKKKSLMLSLLGIIGLVIITVGVTYAFFNYTKQGTTENSVTTGTITFLYTEVDQVGAGISIEDALPTTDAVGKAQTGSGNVFNFKVTANTSGQAAIPYEVTARKKSTSTLEEEAVRVYLTEINGTEQQLLLDNYDNLTQTTKVSSDVAVEKTIYTGTVAANTSYEKNFKLRMWVDNNIDYSDGTHNGKTFTLTINVYANATIVTAPQVYKEALLNGTDPVLTDNLLPINIASDGTVTKANINEKWYNYQNKEWANAVVLKDNTITYNDGDIIPEVNIQSYFVWIPRYKYKIFSDTIQHSPIIDSTQIIDVVFEDKNVTPSTGTTNGSYLTHPAFTTFDTNGLWVGKFETGYNSATSTSTAQVNSVNINQVVVKPNVYSWRSATVGTMFDVSYGYLRDDDSHMMKNTEWGAVSYLQHSNYGSHTSVRVNNNINHLTGYAATTEPTEGYNNEVSIEGNRIEGTARLTDGTYTKMYNTEAGYLASTTANITGIYDMSGGAWEYVMGYHMGATALGGSNVLSSHSNFFTTSSWNKYYDAYPNKDNLDYSDRILGDATGEMGPFSSLRDPDGTSRTRNSWYTDYGNFIHFNAAWFMRGSYWEGGSSAGNFAFTNEKGGASAITSFRIVLAP